MELRLVADTNLFLECGSLEVLPWEELAADPVVVLLTRPVMTEIDRHKAGTGRTKRRAVLINQQVRGLLERQATDLVVRETGPRVVLRLAPVIRLPDDLRDDLDYAKADDRLVGIVATLSRAETGEGGLRTELFTDDTGASASAQALGLPSRLIPGGWKSRDVETDEVRQVRELTRQVAELRAQEPVVVIEHEGGGTVEVVRRVGLALGADEVEALIARLQERHPMRTDFTPPPAEPGLRIGEVTIPPAFVLQPPEEEAIRRYQDEQYPAWLAACRDALTCLHEDRDEPEGPLRLRWLLGNDGTRPARQVRVVFSVEEGPLTIMRPAEHNEEEAEVASTSQPASCGLPRPPAPPNFRKVAVESMPPDIAGSVRLNLAGVGVTDQARAAMKALSGVLPNDAVIAAMGGLEAARRSGALDALFPNSASMRLLREHESLLSGRAALNSLGMARLSRAESLPMPTPFDPSRFKLRSPDPEAFYYEDGWDQHDAVKVGALTCERWRHGVEAEEFELEVRFEVDGSTGGRVLCTVHAENLSRPAVRSVVVRRRVEAVSLRQEAERLVEACG